MSILLRRLYCQCRSARRLEGFKVHFIQKKSKSITDIGDPYVEKYMINYLQAVLDETGKEYLDGLDADMLEKKRNYEILFSLRQAEGVEFTPSKLSAYDWSVILTLNSTEEIDTYLKRVFFREESRKKIMEARSDVYDKLRRPGDDDDLQIIQRIYHMKKYLCQWNGLRSLLHGRPVVLDMDYETLDANQSFETARQIENMYNINLEHHQPCHLHFTSFHKNDILVRMLEMKRNMLVDFHTESLTEVFPKDHLFYLVPEGPMIKGEEIDNNKIFVLGGIGATIRKRSLNRAMSLGIKYGRLPLDEFVARKARSSRVLSLETVLNIMLDKFAGDSWKISLERRLSDEKFQKFPDLKKALTDKNAKKSYVQFKMLDNLMN